MCVYQTAKVIKQFLFSLITLIVLFFTSLTDSLRERLQYKILIKLTIFFLLIFIFIFSRKKKIINEVQ